MNGTPLNISELLNSSNQVLLGEQKSEQLDNAADNSLLAFNEMIEGLMASGSLENKQKAFDLLGIADDAELPFEQLTSGKIFANSTQMNIGTQDVVTEDAKNITAFNNELKELNLNNNLSVNKNINNLFKIQPVNLPDGTYEIEKSEIIDGKLNLELKSENGENIKLSMPVELLKDGIENSGLKDPMASRQTLDLQGQKEVEKLLSKLNLEKLEIENIKETNNLNENKNIKDIKNIKGIKNINDIDAESKTDKMSDNKSENIKLNIIASDKGKEILIKNKLNKIHVKQEVVKESEKLQKSDFVMPKIYKTDNTKIANEILKTPINQNSENVNDAASLKGFKGASLDTENTWNRNNFDVLGLKQTGKNLDANVGDNLLNQQGMFGKNSGKSNNFVETAKLENTQNIFNINNTEMTEGDFSKAAKNQQVRFILPENINSSLKPNGQSVMLKINPDHLGPARLNLSMVNNKLKARVIVNTPAAKAILENSVDRLVEQLAKVDIKVDLIDISLSGEGLGDEMANSHNHWPHKMISKNLKINNNLDNNNLKESVLPLINKSSGYLNTGGVNLLA